MQNVLMMVLAQTITRLDGTKISIAEAEDFASRTLDANQVTGAQIAVIGKGRPVWRFAYGLRQKNPDLPMTPATNIWAASMTKGTFGVYVQQLVEREKFLFDIPIAAQFPAPENARKLVHRWRDRQRLPDVKQL